MAQVEEEVDQEEAQPALRGRRRDDNDARCVALRLLGSNTTPLPIPPVALFVLLLIYGAAFDS